MYLCILYWRVGKIKANNKNISNHLINSNRAGEKKQTNIRHREGRVEINIRHNLQHTTEGPQNGAIKYLHKHINNNTQLEENT